MVLLDGTFLKCVEIFLRDIHQELVLFIQATPSLDNLLKKLLPLIVIANIVSLHALPSASFPYRINPFHQGAFSKMHKIAGDNGINEVIVNDAEILYYFVEIDISL